MLKETDRRGDKELSKAIKSQLANKINRLSHMSTAEDEQIQSIHGDALPPPQPLPSLLSLAVLNERTTTTISTTLSPSLYHLHYEKKQKDVSRLLATFIGPSTNYPAGAATTTTAMDRIIVTATTPSPTQPPPPLSAAKGPTMFYPTGGSCCWRYKNSQYILMCLPWWLTLW